MTGPVDARVRLTPLVEDDLPILFQWINDQDLVELSSAFKPVSAADHRRWFDGIRQREDTRIFAIRRPDDAALIGTCQLLKIDGPARSAELQIRIGDPAARGIGLGTEAVRQLVEFGFRELGLHEIALHVFESNLAAQRSYQKAGFSPQGRVADAAVVGGRTVDAIVMTITNE